MSKTLLVCGNSIDGASVGANLTRYACIANSALIFNATEANKQITYRQGGVLSNLYVRVITNSVTASTTVRTRVNGANGSQSVSIGSSATGEFEDTTNTDTVAAGDKINASMVTGATGTSIELALISVIFDATSNTVSIHATNEGNVLDVDSTTYFIALSGNGSKITTSPEANTQMNFASGGTLQKLFAYVSANARTTNTVFKSRINGADGNMSVTYGSGITGILEDTSNTDTVTAGDLLNLKATTSTGASQALTYQVLKVEFTTTDGSFVMGAARGNISFGNNTYYIPIGFHPQAQGTSGGTESTQSTDANVAFTASNLWYYVSSTAGGNATLTLRKNQGATSLSVLSATTGEFEDATNTVSLLATDEINYRMVSTNSATLQGITMKGAPTVASSGVPSLSLLGVGA